MNAGVDINIKCNNLKINRCSYLEVDYQYSAVINTLTFVVPDTNSEVFLSLKKDDSVDVQFGLIDGDYSTFKGNIHKIEAEDNHAVKVTVVDNAIKLCKTYINESFNDETSVNIIKRLVEKTGLNMGKIVIPDINISHIVFDNITIAKAIKQIYASLESLGNDLNNQDFFVYNNTFYAGNIEIESKKPKITTGLNIIFHNYADNGYAEIECTFIPNFQSCMVFDIDDRIRNITGSFKAKSVRHIVDKGKARTFIGYYYE